MENELRPLFILMPYLQHHCFTIETLLKERYLHQTSDMVKTSMIYAERTTCAYNEYQIKQTKNFFTITVNFQKCSAYSYASRR